MLVHLSEPIRDPGLTKALKKIIDENTAGDPTSLLRWTHKSTRTIADELSKKGHNVSYATVRRRIHELGYSLQANLKNDEGPSPKTRDEQFRYRSALIAAAGTATVFGRGSITSSGLLTSSVLMSRFATILRERASGIRSSTGCSRSSV